MTSPWDGSCPADKAYLDDVKARELAFQLARHETLQKNQTIALLNNQNRVLQLEQKVASQSARNVQLLIALLVMLLATIGYWAFKTKRTQVSFRKLAETDALTGVSNRHHFSRRAAEMLEMCSRNGEQAVLVMLDLDRFKSINDEFGHPVGDWVLIEVAGVCSSVCRRNDLFGRLGGEEFAFLLVGADLESATAVAQLCRARIRAIDTSATGKRFQISASFGVATTATEGHDFHRLMAHADEAMYRAKRAGRDRVELYAAAG
jgi:diguanylate cyclase (GGDEF)-like protein